MEALPAAQKALWQCLATGRGAEQSL